MTVRHKTVESSYKKADKKDAKAAEYHLTTSKSKLKYQVIVFPLLGRLFGCDSAFIRMIILSWPLRSIVIDDRSKEAMT